MRRSSLPGGRAVVGGFLVAAAAVGVFAAYLSATSGPDRSWVVATADVSAGRQLGPEHLGVIAVDLPPELEARAFTDPDEVLGAVTTAPLARHDLVLRTHLVDGSTAGYEQMSFAIDRSRAVAGALRAGDRIDVMVSYRAAEETEVVGRDVLILDVASAESGLGGRSDIVLTVAVSAGTDATTLAHAASHGDLHLVRVTGRGAAGTP